MMNITARLTAGLMAVLLLAGGATGAANAGERVKLTYDVIWGGFRVFTLDVTVLTGNRRYVIDLAGKTRGVLSLFSGGRLEASSEGRIMRDGPQPELYNNTGYWDGEDFRTTLFYNRAGQYVGKTQERPKEWQEKYQREPVPDDMQGGPDPVSLLLHVAQNNFDYASHGADDPIRVRAFDGRKVGEYILECGKEFDDLNKTSRSIYHGDARVCRADYKTVAGHIIVTEELQKEWDERAKEAEKRRKKDKEKGDKPDDDRLKIWVADPDNSGLDVPVRAAVRTSWGTVRMYLRDYSRHNFPARVAARVLNPEFCSADIETQTGYC